jgi:DNA-binding IclR family transcriptional regulator
MRWLVPSVSSSEFSRPSRLGGDLIREDKSGLYSLSLQIFELAHRAEPLRGLETAAVPAMRAFVDDVQQSCNLGVPVAGRVLMLAQVESPANFGFWVRVGAEFPIDGAATGAVLAAFADPTAMESCSSGITDIVFPIFGRTLMAVAAITVPYVATSFSAARTQAVEDRAREAARTISGALGH